MKQEFMMDELLELKMSHREKLKWFDKRCKLLFSDPMNLSWILKDCIHELKDKPIQDIRDALIRMNGGSLQSGKIQGLNPENISIVEGDVFFDFLVLCELEEKLYIGVEGQKDGRNLGYPLSKRATYYLSRIISRQKNIEFMHSDYDNIRKSYCLFVILNGEHRNKIHVQRMYWNDMDGYPVEESDPGVMEIIKLYMGEGNEETNSLRLLELYFFDERDWEARKKILKEEFKITFNEEQEKEVLTMKGFGEGMAEIWYERGEAKGLLQGRSEGLEAGKIIGEERKTIEHAKNLMSKMNLSVEEVFDILEVPVDKREEYSRKILS